MSLFEVDYQPTRRQLQVFGTAVAVFLAAVGTYLLRPFLAAGVAMWLGAAVSVVLTIVQPQRLRRVYVGLMLVTWPLGLVVSWIVLAIFFFGVITPIGLLLRLAGRDALALRFDRRTPSYWTPRQPAENQEQYFRQF